MLQDASSTNGSAARKPPSPYRLTPEQILLSEQRKAKTAEKARLAAEKASVESESNPDGLSLGRDAALATLGERGRIIGRRWIGVTPDSSHEEFGYKVKVMSWNLLAQALVRRELFPMSGNVLKTAAREPMIHREILERNADIMCLQEVDRTDTLLPLLKSAGYAAHYSKGPGKKHGCLVAFRTSRFECADTHQILYDLQDIREPTTAFNRDGNVDSKGSSFKTTNIGALVKIRDVKNKERGFVLATTHLFWHPKYTYERARQVSILLREIQRFRSAPAPGPQAQEGSENWVVLLAGDFNFIPLDATYSLLLSNPLTSSQSAALEHSRVVHKSVDPSAADLTPGASSEGNDEDEEGGARADDDEEQEGGEGEEQKEQDPDKVIKNARRARPEDGLASDEELVRVFSENLRALGGVEGKGVRSLCAEAHRAHRASDGGKGEDALRVFSDRLPVDEGRDGGWEHEWTCYTTYFKLVLDYIFLLPSPTTASTDEPRVLSILEPLKGEQMEPGLPQAGVCGSDHVAVGVELGWRS